MSGQNLPLVSVITPSYNQGLFIRETIESVLFQDYPNLELIVIDGGSTDQTLAILESYSHLGDRFRFVSEPDRGQSHAINKGLAMAKGEIIGWLNSDDTYLPGAIRKAVDTLLSNPAWAMVYGNAFTIDEKSQIQAPYYVAPADFQKLMHGCMICQPAVFLRKEVLQKVGGIDESLHFCMDYDLWIRISREHSIGYLPEYLANARNHDACKTSLQWSTRGIFEVIKTCMKHYGTISETWLTTYFTYHQDKGITGLFSLLKDPAAAEQASLITDMNRYEDLWVPPRFTFSVISDPVHPVCALLIIGKLPPTRSLPPSPHYRFRCSILVNSHIVKKTVVGKDFILEIPVNPEQAYQQIEVHSSHHFSIGDPQRMVSFMAKEVIPLSAEQLKCYHSIAHSNLFRKHA